MKFIKTIIASLGLGLLVQLVPSAYGFALLGPFAPWMQASNGVYYPYDIGGPMDIGSGYRWNVPVITYGFDKSFLDYFGSNGVTAVESAIKTLNNLPPAAQLEPTNYPIITEQWNYAAQVQGINDLKSQTLSLLLEQLGLTHPSSSIYVMKQWTPNFYDPYSYPDYSPQDYWSSWAIPDYIVMRNFDPESLIASTYINNTLYYANIWTSINRHFVLTYPADPFSTGAYSAVAEGGYITYILGAGGFYTGLTYDDVGGLRYQLSAANVNYEKLLPDVYNSTLHKRGVNGAWRPGVEKITFARQKNGGWPDGFRPFGYRYADAYFTNNVLKQQEVARYTFKPDILFCAADNAESSTDIDFPWVIRTGTTRWLNNAAANGNTNGEGPGVIQPPIKITFHKLGAIAVTDDSGYAGFNNQGWGTIADQTNCFLLSPFIANTNNNPLAIKFYFLTTGMVPITNELWSVKTPVGGQAALQISTDKINWNTLITVTNAGAVVEWWHEGTNIPPKFFRAIPQ